jgi:hypothetical protein
MTIPMVHHGFAYHDHTYGPPWLCLWMTMTIIIMALPTTTTIKNYSINHICWRLINRSQEIPQREAYITHVYIIPHAHICVRYSFHFTSLFVLDKQTFCLYNIKLSCNRLIQVRQRVVFINHQEFTVSTLFIHFKNILGIWDS